MNVKWIDINDYLKTRKYNLRITSTKYLIIISIPILLLIILSLKISYYRYYLAEGLVVSKNNMIINVNSNDLNNVINNKKLIINNKEYPYKIKEISDKFMYQSNDTYQTISLSINLNKNINYKNYNTKIRILLSKKKVISTLYEIIKGGENG